MKKEIWSNCSCLTHPRAVMALHEYMRTVGIKKGSAKRFIKGCGKYIVRIRQTKANIIIEVI